MRRLVVRSVYVLTAVAILVLGIMVAANSVTPFHQRLTVLRLKLVGALPDVGWWDLIRMARPGSPIKFGRLVETANPYYSIVNPLISKADVEAGGRLFRSHCANCHGVAGIGGQFGPKLQHRRMVNGGTDWALFRTIEYGIRNTAMKGHRLSEADTWRLVAYVSSLATGPSTGSVTQSESGIAKLKPVQYGDLLNAAQFSDRWLTYSGSYDAHHFSSDTQITPANVSRLRLLWMRQYNTAEESIETSPLVIGNYMFLTVPPSRVEALDARTGDLIWSYDRRLPADVSVCCGIVNRGLAVLGDTLYFATFDAHLIALNIQNGGVRWNVKVADYKSGYSITSAPLIVKGSVITGVAGGEFGARGFVQAFDAATGRKLWRFDTVAQPNQSGPATWGGDSWRTGGAPTWLTGSFDPEANLIYWAVGNPSPDFNGNDRPGDNLYSDSVLALDAHSGKLRWYFQFTPHDQHDWDATEILVLFDKRIDGKQERLLAQANRNGFYYVLNRDTGAFRFAVPYVKQTWAQRIDTTGRPVTNANIDPTKKGTPLFPGVAGGANWQSPSYDSLTGLLYVPFLDGGGRYFRSSSKFQAGHEFLGGAFDGLGTFSSDGVVGAIDPLTGQLKWEHREPAITIGGLLATAGGVVFGSEGPDFFGLDAHTGRDLWHVNTNSRISAAPISYMIDGKQLITIAAGHDLLTFSL